MRRSFACIPSGSRRTCAGCSVSRPKGAAVGSRSPTHSQDALLAIYSEWPELRDVRDDERDRRMYRCLRDAAGRALRAELGRRGSKTSRPQLVSLDRLMQLLDDDAPARDRELTASLLGTMVRDMSEGEAARDARMTLSRGILVAGAPRVDRARGGRVDRGRLSRLGSTTTFRTPRRWLQLGSADALCSSEDLLHARAPRRRC